MVWDTWTPGVILGSHSGSLLTVSSLRDDRSFPQSICLQEDMGGRTSFMIPGELLHRQEAEFFEHQAQMEMQHGGVTFPHTKAPPKRKTLSLARPNPVHPQSFCSGNTLVDVPKARKLRGYIVDLSGFLSTSTAPNFLASMVLPLVPCTGRGSCDRVQRSRTPEGLWNL